MGLADITVAQAQARRRRHHDPVAQLAASVAAAASVGAQGGSRQQARTAGSAAPAPAPQRHSRQRAELQALTNEIIPSLEAARQRLSLSNPLALSLTGPTELERKTKLVNVERRLAEAHARADELGGKIRSRRGKRAEPITAGEVLLALASAIPPVRGGVGVGLGLRALLRGGGEVATETAARGAVAKAVEAAAGRGAVRAAETAAEKTVPQKIVSALKTTAKGGGKAATYPIRHPIKTAKYQALAQAPVALTSGDPGGEFQKLLEGKGVVANVLTGAGDIASKALPGVAGNFAEDLLDLPAQTVPALYMPAAAAVEAAQGDTSRAEDLWKSYVETGLLPAIASGDLGEVGEAVSEHPLFALLEARGAQALVGRGAGAALRAGAAGERGQQIASTERAPLRIGGGLPPQERQFSPDIIEKYVQVVADRRRAERFGGQKAAPTSGFVRDRRNNREKILNERVDRLVSQEEGARRAGRSKQADEALTVRPKRQVDRDGVTFAVNGIVRSPESFLLDLASYSRKLDASAKKLRVRIEKGGPKGEQARAKLTQNRELAQVVERVARDGDPEAIFASARSNVSALRVTDAELVEKGLLDPRQARQARLIPFARTHLNAKYGVSNETKAQITELQKRLEEIGPENTKANASIKQSLRSKIRALKNRKQLIDQKGDALPPEVVERLRREMGGEETAFVSQSPSARGAGSFYRSFSGQRQSLRRQRRTGKATTEGTFDPTYEAIAEQRIRGQGIADAVRGFDRTMREFAVGGKRFKNFAEAEEAARHPGAHGLPKDIAMKPMRLAPLRATSREVETAEQIFDQLDPANQRALEGTVERLFKEAESPGDGPVVLLPEQVVNRLREHVQAASTGRKAIQVISSTFKGTVLPLSPKWLAGNFLDMSLRSMLSGTTPYGINAKLGRRVLQEAERIDPETGKRVKAGLAPGTLFGAADNTKVFRDARQFQGTAIAPIARALGTLRRTPGVRQMVTFYTRYRDGVFALNERLIERPAQYAQIGKQARRELQQTTGKWHSALNVGDDAVRDLAKGLLRTEKQIKYAKSVEQTLGQWTANSPAMKALLVDYAPFGMWARAATRFVFLTLPAKHPIFTAMAALAYEATEEERDKLGLSLFADKPQVGALQGAIPLGDGGMIPTSALTSFGYFADIQKNLADSVLPQFPLQEAAGYDWTGDKLTHEDGTPLSPTERIGAVFASTGEAYVPFFALGQRIAEKGPAYTFNPLRPYDPGLVAYLQTLSDSRQITVPAHSSGSSSSSGSDSAPQTAPWMSDGSSSSDGVAPWMQENSSSSTGTAPWMH